MKKLQVLLVLSMIAMTGSVSFAQKKPDEKHTNLTQAYNALAHAKAALSSARFDDEKGSRADALTEVNNALKETSECFKAAGAAVPPTGVAVNRGDEGGNLKAAADDLATAKQALSKVEGQDFKGHLNQAQKSIEKAKASADATVTAFAKEEQLQSESERNFQKLSAAAAREVKRTNPNLMITKVEAKSNDDERGKTYLVEGRSHGHHVEIEVGEDGRFWM